MESVDELRKYADVVDAMYGKFSISAMMRSIADRIDAEHGRLTHEAVCKAHADGEKNGLRQALGTNASYEKGRKDAENDAVEMLKRIADAAAKGKDIFLFGVIYTPQETDSWERIIADACDGIVSEQSLIDRCKALAGG